MKAFTSYLLCIFFSFSSLTVYAEVSVIPGSIKAYDFSDDESSITLSLENSSRSAIYLTSAQTNIPDNIQLFALRENDGAMMFMPVEKIRIPGKQQVHFGGNEDSQFKLSIVNPTAQKTSVASTFPLTLFLSNRKSLQVVITAE